MGEQIVKRRVLLVDDHPIVRRGLAEVIQRTQDLEVIGEVNDAENALRFLETSVPDLMVVDISLPAMNGIELTRLVRDRYPSLAVLVVSMHEEALYAERALRAGARGYITKLEPPDAMLRAIRDVLSGHVHLSSRAATQLSATADDEKKARAAYADAMSRIPSLTDRELEVFEYIGTGLTIREIAERLKRSVKTVEAHRNNIIARLGLPGSAAMRELSAMWVANGRRIKLGGNGGSQTTAAK